MKVYFLFIPLIFMACKGANHQKDRKYLISRHLSAGGRYYFTIVNDTKTRIEVDGKETETSKWTEFGLIYEVVKDPSGNKLRVTYDKLHVKLQGNGEAKDIDIDNAGAGSDRVNKLLSNIKGASFLVTMKDNGEVERVDSVNELLDKIVAALNTNDVNARKLLRQTISGWIGEDAVKANLEQAFNVFPDTAVYVDDKWTRRSQAGGDIRTNALTTFSLKSVNGNIAEVTTKSEIDEQNRATELMGYNVNSSLKGEEEGSFYTDMTTGLLTKGATTASMSGTFTIMGREVPVKVSVKGKMEGKRL